ncbi:AEC family transporter [Corynebacterium aquatimens]|uniref:Permease n=1 Tax=Corynebacterium aquatimens TaxID=1190508 RepID=A0A931GU55_9CORY|nr:AEC family transporter [Corynebacterium aquatimens]MBG6122430.1 putative permease [Corynebacterium aquatimens]WJY65030.1 Membrane transport protein [Corynebacterium aquatimens]
MLDVITGFAIIFAVIGAGFILAHRGIIGPGDKRLMLNQIAYYVASPCLLFTTVARSDISTFTSPVVLVVFIASALTMGLYWVISAIFFKQDIPTTMSGASSASYFNSVNIGLPIGIYVIGEATYVAPVLLLQMVVFSPLIIAGLNANAASGSTRTRAVLHALWSGITAPVVVGSLLGLIVAACHLTVPDPVLAPIEILGGASIPLILMSFGASLSGSNVLAPGPDRNPTIVATVMKLAVMPAIAFAVGVALGLHGPLLYASVILCALPTAQQAFNYAANYQVGETVARDSVLITTFASMPAMILIALLFGA